MRRYKIICPKQKKKVLDLFYNKQGDLMPKNGSYDNRTCTISKKTKIKASVVDAIIDMHLDDIMSNINLRIKKYGSNRTD